MSKICVVQVLDYEAQKDFKKKRVLKCENCPIKCECEKRKKNNE